MGVLIAGDKAMVTEAFDVDLVAGRVDGLDRLFGADLDADRDVLDRARRKALGVQGVSIADQAAIDRDDLAILDLDPLFRFGGNGVDPCAKRVAAHVLEQGRVATAADNALIDVARLVGGQHLARQPLVVDPHGKVVDRRTLGQGKEIHAFQLFPALVDEHLVHVRGGHLILDGHLHPVVPDAQVGRLVGWGQWIDHDHTVRERRLGDEKHKAASERQDKREYKSSGHRSTSKAARRGHTIYTV